MALTFRRRRNIDPMPRREYAIPARPGDPISPITDDYLVEGEELPDRPAAGAQIVHTLQIVLIAVLAVLSFAIFWIIGLLLNIF